ncbi:uncharacterized protein CANTADRAFT_20111 [Suhomyces tanzawaensis NRRL Y-17324]|uniref:Zn(2)-C6 fungal-type domain-containing protein n=1 Tax=Suhomyces tanzawaensis NRRL Y-17324 TaxID=984487 RepID=A0A1E4SM07_9ASCO|nr:uncharacterized protein CANTADRAFT_20111 [Suhomyces tanzawaensis NRRL Y-17324]ODV80525.1 hypothetical protein CANTADRAFT_20111 [Suhomyces tanzawaensis NRRL Y-17324]
MNAWNNLGWSDATGNSNTNSSSTQNQNQSQGGNINLSQSQPHKKGRTSQSQELQQAQAGNLPAIGPASNSPVFQPTIAIPIKSEQNSLVNTQGTMSGTISTISGHGGAFPTERDSSHRLALGTYQSQQPYPPQFLEHSHHPVYYQQSQPQVHYQPYQSNQGHAVPEEATKIHHPHNSFPAYEGTHYAQSHAPNYETHSQPGNFNPAGSFIAAQNEESHNTEHWDQTHQYPSTPSIASQQVQGRVQENNSFPTPKQPPAFNPKEVNSSKSSASSPNMKYETSPSSNSSFSLQSGGRSYSSQGKSNKPVAKRSRMGCLTCRQRKKRCSESKPKCAECSRLRLNCVWPTPGTERKNKPKEAKEEENTMEHEIYGKIKVLRGIVEYKSN